MAPSRGVLRICSSNIQHIRSFSAVHQLQSGHNRWSKIKHDKAKKDADKHRQRAIFAAEITHASKTSGPEPSTNPRLADLITKAKKEGFAKLSIEAAIARGQGKSMTGVSLESVTIEGILPNNVAVIVDCETDSRLRTLADVRLALRDAGGSATPCAYLFERQGKVVFEPKDSIGLEEALEIALEAGAIDVDQDEAGSLVVSCGPSDTKSVGETMSDALGLVVRTSEIIWRPNEDTKVTLTGDDLADELGAFVDNVMDRETAVQAVSMNVAQGSSSEGAWSDLQSRLGT